MMTYRVFSGPRGSGEISPFAKERMLFKEFSSLDEALSWSQHLGKSNRVPLLIEGDDRTQLSKQAIVDALQPTA